MVQLLVSGRVPAGARPAGARARLLSMGTSRPPPSSFLAGTALRVRVAPRAPAASAGGALSTQMNLFERAFRVMKSYANAVITSAEDPEKMLEQTVNEMQEDLIKMRQASAQVMASQKQLEMKYKQAQATSDDWYKRAQLALQKGDEELAREALKRRQSYQANADGMSAQVAQQKDAVDKLIANTRLLEVKMAEARSKKDTLKARAASAKMSKKASEMVGGLSTTSSLGAFERMEEKVLAMESEAEAVQQLSAPDGLADKFLALEGSGGVEDELAMMKRSLQGGGPAGQLPPGRTVADAIEVELEALRRKSD